MNMITFHRRLRAKRQNGQTLIIAVLVLGVLLAVGLAFAGIVSNNVRQSSQYGLRTVSSELSQSGVTLAHYQLVNSSLGADWRPSPTPPTGIDAAGFSRDPDSIYLRQGSGLLITPDPARPLETVIDLGGPDMKGPYSRETTEKGRRLIRIRYNPGDMEALARGGDSTLRQAGRVKNFLLIESIGRAGSIRTQGKDDPTRTSGKAIQVAAYANAGQVLAALGEGLAIDSSVNPESRKTMAFASIGLIETARFITNKHNRGELAEIGTPVGSPLDPNFNNIPGLGLLYGATPVTVTGQFGRNFGEPNLGRGNGWRTSPGGGSLYSNAGLKVFGQNFVNLNASFGESWLVNGPIVPGTDNANLRFSRFSYDRNTDQWVSLFQAVNTLTNPIVRIGTQLNSELPSFNTASGLLRDNSDVVDQSGFPRGVPRKEPPSMMAVDPQTGLNRYLNMTRNTGITIPGTGWFSGRFGYGQGVYVDSPERGNLDTDDERREQGAVRSLPNDWLNPNNRDSIGWQGPYYIPVAAYLHLLPDGFEIIRDSRSSRRHWRSLNGGSSGQANCVYRIREVEFPLGSGRRQFFIINSITAPALVNQSAAALTDDNFRNSGQPFNGVLYFEGDVRTRGVIPTDVQLTVAAKGTIYIEGSITKGLVNVTGTDPAAYNTVITRPSRSMLMLMARDYTTINTTMFFGPTPGSSPATKTTDILPDTPNPAEIDPTEFPQLDLFAQFLVAPEATGSNLFNPQTWQPLAANYSEFGSGTNLVPQLLMSLSADDNGPAYAQMTVRAAAFADPGVNPAQAFPFPTSFDFLGSIGVVNVNSASGFFAPAPALPIFGLGDSTINAYPKFQTVQMSMLSNPVQVNRRLRGFNDPNAFELGLMDPTIMSLRFSAVGSTPAKNLLLARTAIVPHDVKIEASLFAEEGSYFVIPGNWFNTNPDDTREAHTLDVNATNVAQANHNRFIRFGNTPAVPFYGEPVDVRVTLFGAVSENMPAPMSQQIEWKRKWGWIPGLIGSAANIPAQHVPNGFSAVFPNVVPNMTLIYDPALSLGSTNPSDPNSVIRRSPDGWVLPPMPRLPVSPTLAYFGDVNP